MDIVRKVEFKKVDFLNSIFLKFKKIESRFFKFGNSHEFGETFCCVQYVDLIFESISLMKNLKGKNKIQEKT